MSVSASHETTCRRCVVRCDTVVYLGGCHRAECPALYSTDRDGRTYVGCLNGVFAVEIDTETFAAMQATRVGFGALRAVRPPLPICDSAIDQTFQHRATSACVNPDFRLSTAHGDLRVSPRDVRFESPPPE